MKILFLNLPYKFDISRASRWPEKTKSGTLYYPYWLCYAAGVCMRDGFQVELVDCLVDGMHKGLGQQVYTVRVNTLTSILDVALLYLLLPRWGIAGYYVSFWVSHGVNFYLSIRRLGELAGPLTGRRTPDTIEACSK